jgi:hypothetical protein
MTSHCMATVVAAGGCGSSGAAGCCVLLADGCGDCLAVALGTRGRRLARRWGMEPYMLYIWARRGGRVHGSRGIGGRLLGTGGYINAR